MTLQWTIHHDTRLVVATGDAIVSRRDIETYLAATLREGTKTYSKLIDLMASRLVLDRDELDDVAEQLVHYGTGIPPGPVAMVVGSPLTLDMAVLLKQRVGDRPFRIFTSLFQAQDWLRAARSLPEQAGPLSFIRPPISLEPAGRADLQVGITGRTEWD